MKDKETFPTDQDLDSEIQESEIAPSEINGEANDYEDVTESEKDPIEILNENLQKKEDEIAELKNEFLRYKAETENFKKRLRKEKEDFSQYANERLLKELTLINDNLERALSAPSPTVESLQQGVEMILKQFHSFLEKQNVEPIEALGKTFDPNLHEVMCQVESDEHEENTVTEVYSKGYQLNGRILHPSKVVIAKAPEKKSPESSD
ncbi:MAG: nucleotide exchange factor GrpE [Nitrospinae bacterium]|jgi:molecular chaperone GrpE|nr:nucleotide exchange factor GrpE [Nitrospinota bacterium]MDA1108708.1 nucleotide exchange factor GrpE [Nitrospinota bacterium]